MGLYVLIVADFDGRGGRRGRAPSISASMAEWGCTRKRPDLDNGGIRLPFTEDGMCSCTPPRTFRASKAATLRGARGGTPSDPRESIMKLHVCRGRAPAQEIRRLLVDVDEVPGRCDAC